MVPAAESSSSNVLLYVLIGVGVLVVLAAVGLAVWLSKRTSTPPQAFAPQYGTPSSGPMAPGWYPDPQGQARVRWFDGNQWTANTQN